MTIKLPFINRIKVMSWDFINGKNAALNRRQHYEIEVLPTSTRRRSESGSLSRQNSTKPTAFTALVVFDRLRLVNRESRRKAVEHTRSNLG